MESIDTIVIAGKEYELFDEPSHGVVRAIKKMQREIVVTFINKHKEMVNNDREKVNAALMKILDENPAELAAYEDINAEFESLATISFATNIVWSFKKLENLSEKDFKALLDKSTEIIGGDFTVFL